MKRVIPCLAAAAALLSGCGGAPDPWLAAASFAADAPLGATATVASFEAPLGDDCLAGTAPILEIVQQGSLGAASIGAGGRTIEDEGGDCDGVIVPQSTVFYDGAASGIDTVVVRESAGMTRPDIIHTGRIRVR